ncbi:hypothetical protein FQN55_004824 [Onygenales sp. PD_40]|nr:hypothetical protein FQN55_004824 [Onygenales sp. PD_40]KAK2775720.1 hypothetical protein FQN53_003088 [Emmonsiellopsis sp. PD_33]KAK2785401.1 hypothetical protein FQN52_008461 [Onygenales sp. PD_12]
MLPTKSPFLRAGAALLALLGPEALNAHAEEYHGGGGHGRETTYYNPIFPGSHPDPSCIFLEEWEETFFCASSSFNIFPGLPIHASRDLRNWKRIVNVLNREDQLPMLSLTNGSTSGIWAPTLRYHEGTFYLLTTLVHDKNPIEDPGRWDNVIFTSTNPYDPESWSDPVHFEFLGYDTSPYWDEDGKVYVAGAHPWQISPGIYQREVNLETGEVGPEMKIWDGTGGMAPEGPHIIRKDDWYYLLAAEGGTGVDHMVTIARSKNINGPYESNPANPVLTNANTTEYFQTVGHVDLFQDANGNWWGVALSTRSGPEYLVYPMGRETVMVPVTWEDGGWPVFEPVRGEMRGPLPREDRHFAKPQDCPSEAKPVTFEPGSQLPDNFVYWRTPRDSYTVSEDGHPNTLALSPSKLNLTGYDGNYAETGQTFVGVRQTDTLFTYAVDVEFEPVEEEEEAGVSVFLTMNHHIDLGIVNLPPTNSNSTTSNSLIPHFRFRAESAIPKPATVIEPLPAAWHGQKLTLEIKAINITHYAFSAGPAGAQSQMKTIAYGEGGLVSWGFTGTLVGVYATSNDRRLDGEGTKAFVSNWRYWGQGQFRS